MPPDTENQALLGQLRIDRTQRDGGSNPGRRRWIAGAVLLLITLIGAGAWFGLSGGAALPVRTVTAQPIAGGAANASVIDATGYVTARREATVSAQITGTLIEVLIEEGDHVKLGQVLGRLEDTAQRAALAQAQAQLKSARALLVQYEAQLRQSERDVKRAEDLVERKLVSQQAVEQARTQVETGTAQAQGQRKQIELAVTEAYINRVQPGQRVESVLNAYPDWRIPSHVIAIIPTADRSKATVKVRIGLDAKDTRIVPDMGVRVSFLEEHKPAARTEERPRGVLVPAAALRKEGDRDIVFVLKERRAQRRTVTLGGPIADSRQVLAGVTAGEAVIVDAPAGLRDDAAATAARPCPILFIH